MRFRSPRNRTCLISSLLLAAVLSACGGLAPSDSSGSPQGETTRDPHVLAWNPNTLTLDWYATTGQPTMLDSVVLPRALAIPCAQSPDGGWLAMHLGRDGAAPQAIYPLNGPNQGELVPLGQHNGLGCTLPGGVQFSPDMSRLGLVRFSEEAIRANFAAGTLHLLSLPSGAVQYMMDDVVAYHLFADGVLALRLFGNPRGEAMTADLVWWDGAAERSIVQEIRPEENCQFVSGQAIRTSDRAYMLFGEACRGRGSGWRLFRADFAGGEPSLIAQGLAGGRYFTYAATSGLWMMPGGEQVMIAYPNGLNIDIANLARVRLSDGQVTPVLLGVAVPMHPPAMPGRFVFNPTGTRFAAVTRDGNGGEALYVYDLARPETDAVQLAGGSRSDRIGGVAWTADGNRLYYIISGDTSALYAFDLTMQGDRRPVLRGTFQGLAISPDGTAIATSRQNRVSGDDVRNSLILIRLGDPPREDVLVEGSRGESALVPFAIR
jgi:hypothetical protein